MSLTVEKSFEEQLVNILKALSDETRLKLVRLMAKGETTCGDLNCDFNLSGPTMSHHLKVLEQSGLLIRRREGQQTFNSLNHELYGNFLKALGGLVK